MLSGARKGILIGKEDKLGLGDLGRERRRDMETGRRTLAEN